MMIMKFKMNKRGAETKLISVLVSLFIGIALLILIIAIFFPQVFKYGDIIKGEGSKIAADPDGDGIKGLSDDCPCTYGEVINKGCPGGWTDQQKSADKKRYNADTGCGKLPGEVSEAAAGEEVKPKEGPAAFGHYRSIEIFGQNDGSADPEEATILQACPGWVGLDCPSEDNDCDGDEFNYQEVTDSCWVMASELDYWPDVNDCGQARLGQGTIISVSKFSSLAAIGATYTSVDNEDDPENLFSWSWKSLSKYGSLLCYQGLWFGCSSGQEGQTLKIDARTYTCKGSEWT